MKREKVMRKCNVLLTGLFCVSVLVSGCVSSAKYNALEDQCTSLGLEKDALEQDKSELNSQIDRLVREKNRLKTENSQLDYELTKANEKINDREQQKQGMQEMIVALEEKVSSAEAQVSLVEESLRVELVDKLFFKRGSAEVSKKGRALLKKIVPILKDATDNEILIIGHADKLPPSRELAKKYPSNWELSVARATSVIQILQWGYGIEPKRMVAQGVGHYRNELIKNGSKESKLTRVVEIYLNPQRQ